MAHQTPPSPKVRSEADQARKSLIHLTACRRFAILTKHQTANESLPGGNKRGCSSVVERHLAKVNVARSNRVTRLNEAFKRTASRTYFLGAVLNFWVATGVLMKFP
jgi:hypothetical protein